jgi:pyruvate/2-oxoglutarate dehydrogenase complex dihydrolipoamide acyltransferase (E2) component
MTVLKLVHEIAVPPELWACSLLPQGVVEQWLFPHGSRVNAGDPLATIRIEDSLHELTAPAKGRLSIAVKRNGVIDPGTVLGTITREPSGI